MFLEGLPHFPFGQKHAFSYVTREIIRKKHARVMVLVHDTSSECALQIYEVSLKYLKRLSSYREDTILYRTDPRTNAGADERGKKRCLPTLPGGET